jgi:hypothetical protein
VGRLGLLIVKRSDLGKEVSWKRVGSITGFLLSSIVVGACGIAPRDTVQTGLGASPKKAATAISAFDGLPSTISRLDECLKKQGVSSFEAATHKEAAVGVGGVLGQGGMRVPAGITRSQFEEALSKCGMTGVQVQGAPIVNPTFRRRILRLAACLRRDGFTIPAPNMSGKRPVFDTKHVDITSPGWHATIRKCRDGI